MQKQPVNPADYVWVITVTKRFEDTGRDWEESLLGLADDQGNQFVPVTTEREAAQALLYKLPPEPDKMVERQVEAMNKALVRQQAQEGGFDVYLVDGAGRVLGQLGA